MEATVKGIKGEFRALTPTEIGDWVRMLREARDLKRVVLAAESSVSEKTLERLEAGTRVSAAVYRQVAKALGLGERTFLDERYIPTPEEAVDTLVRQAQTFEANCQEIDVERATDPRQFVRLFGASLLYFDDSPVAAEHAMAAAEFSANLSDWNDIGEDLDAPARLEAGQTLLKIAQKIEALGYLVKLGSRHDCGQPGWRVAVVIIVPRHHPSAPATRVAIPRAHSAQPT